MAKAKLIYVFSTLAAGVDYTLYTTGPGGVPIPTGVVKIKGGAGVVGLNNIETPRGVATLITAEEKEQLEAHPVFAMHKKNGYVTISEETSDPEVAAADMKGRDVSAPMVDSDFVAGEGPKGSATGKS